MAQITNERFVLLNNSGTAPLRVGYDASNFLDVTLDSSGNPTYNAVGSRHVWQTASGTERMRLDSLKLLIGDTANAKMTVGITLDQAANTDEILALRASTAVAHGMTDFAETDVFADVIRDAAVGGVIVRGFSAGSVGASFRGNATTDDTARSTAARGYVELVALKKSGTSVGAPAANANMVVARDGAGAARWLVDAEGDTHADAVHNDNAWDEHDDVALLSTFRAVQMRDRATARRIFGQWATDERNKDILHRTGVITVTRREDGGEDVFYSQKGVLALLMDAVRQVGERVDRVAVHAGVDPALLRGAP